MKKVVLLAFVLSVLSTALSLCAAGLLMLQIAHASPYTDIDVETAYNMITNGSYPDLLVLDVRTQSEYDSGHIYGAVWIPHTELDARIGELAGHENHEIIVYCRTGVRSVNASEILDSHNFTKVYNMLGGITEWQSTGYPVWIATVHNVNTSFNYDTIQAAIDAPKTLDEHTILVDAGTYVENVVVDKSVSLIGENKITTIIDGSGIGTVVTINTSNVNISGFMIQNSGHTPHDSGIRVEHSNGNNISHNIIANNLYGIYFYNSSNNVLTVNSVSSKHRIGIYLDYSSNNTLTGNNASNNGGGICLYNSSNNILTSNNASNNYYGIMLSFSSNNTLTGNNASNNQHNFGVDGRDFSDFNNYVDTSNTVDGKPICYLIGVADTVYDAKTNPGTIYVINCNNITIRDLVLTKNDYGVFFFNTTNSKVENVTASNNGGGICIRYSSNITLKDNNIASNIRFGMYSDFSVTYQEETYYVTTISNSTISEFQFNEAAKTISFNVTGIDYTLSFCNVTIPNILIQDLWQGNYIVLMNGKEPATMNNWTDGTNTYIYFTYFHSTHKVEIVPEFPTWTSILLIFIVLTVAIAIYKRRSSKQHASDFTKTMRARRDGP